MHKQRLAADRISISHPDDPRNAEVSSRWRVYFDRTGAICGPSLSPGVYILKYGTETDVEDWFLGKLPYVDSCALADRLEEEAKVR